MGKALDEKVRRDWMQRGCRGGRVDTQKEGKIAREKGEICFLPLPIKDDGKK